MGSFGTTDEELNAIKQAANGHSSIIQSLSDTETQSPLSVSCSGEEHIDGRNGDECYLFDGTTNLLDVETQMMNLDFETQVDNCDENLSTQLLDDDDDGGVEGDGVVEKGDEGSDRTEVLSDSEDECEVGGGDNAVKSPCEQNGKDFVVDSDVSVDTKFSSGSVRKTFMSVRTAALRYSGNAARIVTTNRIDSDSSRIKHNIQSVENQVCEDDGIASIGNPTSADTRVKDVKNDHFISTCSQNIRGLRDETKPKGVRSVVRELFYEDTSTGNNGSVNDNVISDGERDFPELLAHDQDFAGLSYIDSHEPGEESQVNALGIVDNFLFVNDVQLSPEVRPEKSIKEKTPPVSRATGSHKLAKKHSLRNPIKEAAIFDWEDIHEDEGGGDFFCKTKKTFFGSRGRGQRSSAKSQNPRNLNFSRCQGVGDNNEGSNLGQKVVDLALSESKSVLRNSDEKVEVSEMRSKNNLMKELDENLDVDAPEQQLEATGTCKDLPDMYDVGFDTQMAAEAMEALFYAPPANCDADNVYQATEIVVDGTPDCLIQKQTRSKHDSVRKRPSTDSGAMVRQSKRAKMESGNRTYNESVKHSRNPRVKDLKLAPSVKTKGKNNKEKEEQHISNGNGNANLGRRSCKLIEHRDTVGALESPQIKQRDTSHSSFTPKGNHSLGKGQSEENYGTFTPIACRTRRSKTVKPLKGLGSSNNSGEETKAVSYLRGKRSSCLDEAVNVKSSKFGCKKIYKLGNNQRSQQEPLEHGGMHEEMPTTSYDWKDTLSYHPRGKRTHRKKSDRLNKVDDLDGQPTVCVEQVHGQPIISQKGSNVNVGSSCVNVRMKGEAQTSVNPPHPSLSCPGKSSKGSLTGQTVLEPGSVDAVMKCSSSVMNEKVVPKDLVGVKSFWHCDKKGDAGSLLSAKGCIDAGSSKKDFDSSNTVNATSNMCMEDDHCKKSCKKSTPRDALVREHTRLDVIGTPKPSLKDLRKRRDMTNIRVLFSHHLDEDIIKQQQKISARLGVSVVSSSADATHFITDKFARTRNMLEAISLGKPVVTHLWLASCGQASCFIEEKNYILRDAKKEKEIGFSMPVSLARARESPLLQGKQIFITRNIEPSKEMIESLVKAVHGQVVERIGKIATKDNKFADDLLILSCEKDYSVCSRFLQKGAAVYSSELLLSGIVTQKLEFERYRLFTDHTKRTRLRN